MTYGEYWIALKLSMQMIDGQWSVIKPLKTIPKPMKKDEAFNYYNYKLRSYWQSQESYKKQIEA